MKILWHSVAPWAPTGYGQQTATFTPRIKADGHDVVISAYYGLQGAELNWRGIRCLPSYAAHYGTDTVVPHAVSHFQDEGDKRLEVVAAKGVVITLCDVFVLDAPMLRDLSVAAWTPVDHETLPPVVRTWFGSTGAIPIAMSRFGEGILRDAGLSPLYVPHGFDPEVFYPAPQDEARERAGLPQDAFVISIVAANMGNDASRKAFSEQIEAFRILRKRHSDAILVLHTDVDSPVGVHIRDLISDLPDGSVKYCDQYLFRRGMPNHRVAELYRASDLFSNTSWGEGFGVPIIEAQACGTPVVVTDTTAMPELVGAGHAVPGERFWHDSQRAWARRPYIDEIAHAYEMQYLLGRDAPQRSRAWEFAQQYNADTVMVEHWKPVLERLEEALERRRVELTAPPVPDDLTRRKLVESGGFVWMARGKRTDDWVAFSDHEATLQPVLEAMIPEGGVFLDVGAHVGRWTIRMSTRADHVYAVEPNPVTLKSLRQHLAMNDVDNVTVIEVAAWDEAAVLELHDDNHRYAGGSTRTLPLDAIDLSEPMRVGQVAGVRLDDVVALQDLPRLDCIKLDVEGADLHALRGMRGLIARHRPALLVECHDLYGYYTRQELRDLLTELGYPEPDLVRYQTAEYLACWPTAE